MILLGVPYLSQWLASASRYVNDCGPTCVAMLLAYVGRLGALTVDALAAETSLASSDTGLPCQALVQLGARHGLDVYAGLGVSLDAIRADLEAGWPVIALVWYGAIANRLDQQDTGGHFVVVTGYGPTGFYLNDPDWWVAGGRNFYVPSDQLQAALAAYGYQAVRINSVTAKDTTIARLNDALTAAEGIVEANGAPVLAKTSRALNVRSGPGTTYAVKATLPAGACVPVSACGTAGWYILSGWDGCYVSADPQYWTA